MSTLRRAVEEYLNLRRSLGFKLHDAGKALPDFVTFMEQHRAPSPRHWLSPGRNNHSMFNPHIGRDDSASYASLHVIAAPLIRVHQIPAQALLPFQPKRARPYLYSDDEEIRSSLVYERLMAGDVRRRVSADRVDRLAPVRRP